VGEQFEAKWLDQAESLHEDVLTVPDFSTTGDLYGVVSNINDIRVIPVGAVDLYAVIGIALVCGLPLVIASIPFDTVMADAMKPLLCAHPRHSKGFHADSYSRGHSRDAPVWEAMRRDMWPDGADDHAGEIAMFFAGRLEEPDAVLMAEDETGTVVGVAELSIRGDVAGLEGQRAGYVEGLYVQPEVRGRGVARTLMRASRMWAHQQKCTAFASDRAGRVVIDKTF
jgi:aminoglycoside 6'-N-acetyltransferase I